LRGGRFDGRGNLKVVDFINFEIASLRSQRQAKGFFDNLFVRREAR